MDLTEWILIELNDRGLSQNQLSKMMGMSNTSVNNVINKKISPSADFCISLAEALHEPPDFILRLGGHLPPVTAHANSDMITQQVVDIMKYMDDKDRSEILSYIRYYSGRIRDRIARKIAT